MGPLAQSSTPQLPGFLPIQRNWGLAGNYPLLPKHIHPRVHCWFQVACSFVLCSRIQYSQKGVLINTVFCVTLGSSDAVAPYRRCSEPLACGGPCLLWALPGYPELPTTSWTQGFPHSSVAKESACNAGDPWFDSWVGKIHWRRDRLPSPVFLSFPCGPAGKESACNAGDLGSILGLGRCPGEGKAYPLQYSGLENSMDCIVYGVAKSRTGLSDFYFASLHFLNLLFRGDWPGPRGDPSNFLNPIPLLMIQI